MVPKHGRGALLTGGKPGNRGGPGRPPSAIRKRCQDSFEERIPILEGFVDDENEKTSDRIKAHEVLGKYGSVDKIALAVEEQPEKEMTPERIAVLWKQLEQIRDIQAFEKLLVRNTK